MKTFAAASTGIVLGVIASVATAQGVVYFADPAPADLRAGDAFTIEIRGREFPVALDGGGLNLHFDGTRLALTHVQSAPEWEDLFSPGSISNAAGTVEGLYFNTFSMAGVSGDFGIVTLSFEAIASGLALLELSGDELFVFGGLGQQFMPTYLGRQIAIAAVPEPATWTALLAGAIALLLRERRRSFRDRRARNRSG